MNGHPAERKYCTADDRRGNYEKTQDWKTLAMMWTRNGSLL